MTVEELINKLKQFPMSADVVFNSGKFDEIYSVDDIEFRDYGKNGTVELLP